jgi:hypothetical protein
VVGVLSEKDGLVCLLAEKYGGRRGSKESYYESPLVQSLQGILASHIYIYIGSESIGSDFQAFKVSTFVSTFSE